MSEVTVRLPRKRHLRKGAFVRNARSKYLLRYIALKAEELFETATVFPAAFTEDETEVVAIDHGLEVGEGPFIIDSEEVTGDAVFLWVNSVIDDDTFTLATKRGTNQPDFIAGATNAEADIFKAEDDPAVYEYFRQNRPEVVRNATSADSL